MINYLKNKIPSYKHKEITNIRDHFLTTEIVIWVYGIFCGSTCYMMPDFWLSWIGLIVVSLLIVKVSIMRFFNKFKISKVKFTGTFDELARSLSERGFYMTGCKKDFFCFRTMLVFNHYKIKIIQDKDSWILEADAGLLRHLRKEIGNLKIKLI